MKARVKFGETTDSYDADGELVASLPVPPMTLEEINEAAAAFQGDQMQMPPMVSAVKDQRRAALQNGAQRHGSGAQAPPDPRLQLSFHQLRGAGAAASASPAPRAPTSAAWPMNWARKLGCGAHLATLRRVVSGKFDVDDAITFEDALKFVPRRAGKAGHPIPDACRNGQGLAG